MSKRAANPSKASAEERVREIVRQFPENGLKQVLSSEGNARDLLALAKAPMLSRIDFAGMQIDATTYVTAEYRHVSSDLVLNVGLKPSSKGGRRKRLLLTILIELQSQPDRLMKLRVLEYLVQVWKQQAKRHGEQHGSLASVKLTPVLPLVFHTGSYPWEGLGKLTDLMDEGAAFAQVTPEFEPLFVSLPDVADDELTSGGGYLGQVLALLKARKQKRAAFAQRLGQVVAKLREMAGPEQLRKVELLSYVEGLVYHSRGENEHQALRQRVDEAMGGDKLEVDMVRRTMADAVMEKSRLAERLAERKRTLVEQLQDRWGPLPEETAQAIEATQDAEQLRTWLRRFPSAKDLASVGILSQP